MAPRDAIPRSAIDPARARLGVLTSLLAAALVLHVLWWHGPASPPTWTAVVAAAAWALGRPTSVGRLALLLGVAGAAIVAELPALGTHLLLVLVPGSALLVLLLARAIGSRRRVDAAEVLSLLLPLLRAQVVVLYVAAATAKLNANYLDPSRSPAADLVAQVAWFSPGAPGGTWWIAPTTWGSIAVELALPVLLLVRPTRRTALVVGLTFHAVLASSGTVPFTAVVLVLYVAFLPIGVVDRLARLVGPWRSRARFVPPAALLVVVVAAVLGVAPGRTDGGVLASGLRVLVVGAALGLAALVARDGALVRDAAPPAPAPGRGAGAGGAASPARGVLVVAATLVTVLVAVSPYAGRRVGDAFTMYSALDTSDRGWNSFVVPRAARRLGRELWVSAGRSRHPGRVPASTTMRRGIDDPDVDRALTTLRPPGPPISSKLVAVRLHTRRTDATVWVDRGDAYVPEAVVRPGATGLFYDGLSHRVEDVRGESPHVTVWASARAVRGR